MIVTRVNHEPNPPSLFLQEIAEKKAADVALSCLELFIHWFLTTFSCFYPAYDRFYKSEVAKIESVPKLTKSNLAGTLVDKTRRKIAGFRENIETLTFSKTNSLRQALTLDGKMVLITDDPKQVEKNYFELPYEDDRLIVQDSENLEEVLIEEYNSCFREIRNSWVVDLNKVYIRNYTDLDGVNHTEEVYHVNSVDETIA